MAPPRQVFKHTVAPGDHMSRVAATNGFKSHVPLTDEPTNAPLIKLRKTPHILGVGDPVTVPPLEAREVDRATDQRHRFHATIPELVLRVKHLNWVGVPITPPATALGDGKPLVVTPGSAGVFTVPVTPVLDRVRFAHITNPKGDDTLLRVGFLQPVDTVAGARERLTNLGYEAGDKDDVTNLQLRSAVEEFQCDQKLLVDGRIGPDTRARLLKVHGC
jgi:hypothetical protein